MQITHWFKRELNENDVKGLVLIIQFLLTHNKFRQNMDEFYLISYKKNSLENKQMLCLHQSVMNFLIILKYSNFYH